MLALFGGPRKLSDAAVLQERPDLWECVDGAQVVLKDEVPVWKLAIQGKRDRDVVNYHTITVRRQASLNPEGRLVPFLEDCTSNVHGGAIAGGDFGHELWFLSGKVKFNMPMPICQVMHVA